MTNQTTATESVMNRRRAIARGMEIANSDFAAAIRDLQNGHAADAEKWFVEIAADIRAAALALKQIRQDAE